MNRLFKIKPSVVHEKFNDEIVIVNLDTGSYYSAQATAGIIWGLVCEGTPEAGILSHVQAEYAGNGDDNSRAATAFLDRLVEEALVDHADAGEAGREPAAKPTAAPEKDFSAPLLLKYTDMEDMLLLDPIHEVDDEGWPSARKPPGN